MNINHLPTELLDMILSDETIPQRERIALRAVSKHWLAIIEKRLAITPKLILNDDNHLPFTVQSIPHLIRLFPHADDLTVNLKSSSPYVKLPPFLTQYSSTLKTLQLCNMDSSLISNYIWSHNFIRAINSLTELTSFSLLNLNYEANITAILTALRPTLAHLQQLVYTAKGGVHQKQLIWKSFISEPLARMIQLELGPLITPDYVDTVADIVATFPSLQRLSLSANAQFMDQTISLTKMLRHLSSLKHLSELYLSALYQTATELSLPLKTDRQLLNVRALIWDIPFPPVDSLEAMHPSAVLAAWFPNLQQLTLEEADAELSLKITNNMLSGLVSLEHLTELSLSYVDYTTSRLTNPRSTERRFTSVKKLKVLFIYPHENTNVQDSAIISRFASWFPNVASFTVGFHEEHYRDDLEPLVELTTLLLHNLSHLERLTSLQLPKMRCVTYLEAPSPIDRSLNSLKFFNLTITDEYPEGDLHLCSALAAWFPSLEELTVDNSDPIFYQLQLTSNMLRDLANLENLSRLELPKMLCKKEHLEVDPLPTDRQLTCLKKLRLNAYGFSTELDGERLISALVAHCPGLEELSLSLLDQRFYLTRNMLRILGRLEHLDYLDLSAFFYSKQHLDAPLSADQPLTTVKTISDLAIIDSPTKFNGEHFCTTIAAWFPHLEELNISINQKLITDSEASQPYRHSIEANRHHFGGFNYNWLDFSFWLD